MTDNARARLEAVVARLNSAIERNPVTYGGSVVTRLVLLADLRILLDSLSTTEAELVRVRDDLKAVLPYAEHDVRHTEYMSLQPREIVRAARASLESSRG
jgi:hypothetical protein